MRGSHYLIAGPGRCGLRLIPSHAPGVPPKEWYRYDSSQSGGADISQLLVRDLTPETIERLKEQAKQQGRSLQAEVKHPAGQVPTPSRLLSDSADLVREDRDR
jgi:antitoxin FitA-like protein